MICQNEIRFRKGIMNLIWLLLCICSILAILFRAPQQFLPALTAGAEQALALCVTLCGIYAVWLGVMNVAVECGLVRSLCNVLRPITKKLFGPLPEEAEHYVALNLSANLIGVGNASTPSAIQAIRRMDDRTGRATKAMVMLFVLNASSIQILPTTVISLRAATGSTDPSAIFLPTLISTCLNTALGVFLVWLCYRKRR